VLPGVLAGGVWAVEGCGILSPFYFGFGSTRSDVRVLCVYKVLNSHVDVRANFTKQRGRNISAAMKRDGGRSTVVVSELFMRTTLTNLTKAVLLQ